MGKGSGTGEGCPESWETDTVGSCAKEDRRCAEGAMGEGEGGKQDGIAPFLWGRKRDSHLGRVIRFSALVVHKNRRMGRSATPNILPVFVLMVMAYAIAANESSLFSQINSAIQCGLISPGFMAA